ncbi:MAG: methyltransferase domain-containing protein [Raineya sp.]|nr:methyltransferase domain-containing protein [Raineya sp.]
MKHFIRFLIRFVPRKYLQKFGIVALRLVAIFYKGNQVECPISGKTYRKFLPYGRIQPRENALCPDSLSLERHRLLWLYLQRKTNFFQAPLRVLHIAPEICFLKKFEKLPNLKEYITADLESPWAKVKMDIHQMPFEANSFDVVFCNHVLEHVTDDFQALREIYRVLKPQGWAILQSPVDWNLAQTYEDKTITAPQEREKAFGQSDHLRLYGKDYAERIASVGFRVVVDDFVKTLSAEEIKRYALDANEMIFVAFKD